MFISCKYTAKDELKLIRNIQFLNRLCRVYSCTLYVSTSCSERGGDTSRTCLVSDSLYAIFQLWRPPTPPCDDQEDPHVDHAQNYIYESTPLPEVQLPRKTRTRSVLVI